MLHESLRTLAHLTAIRGRHDEAQELRTAADELLAGHAPVSASDHLRGLLQRLRDAGSDVVIAEELERVPQAPAALLATGECSSADLAALTTEAGATSRRDIQDVLEWAWPGTLDDYVRRRIQAALIASPQPTGVPLGRAAHLFEALIPIVEGTCPPPCRCTATGGYRRFEPIVDELGLVIASDEPDVTLARLAAADWSGPILHVGAGKLVVRLDGLEVAILVVAAPGEGPALAWTTGPREYVRALREEAGQRGLRFSAAGLERNGARVDAASEAALHETLGLPDVPPELRIDVQVIHRVRQEGIPPLVTQADMRGDLHVHTDWSDGRDTIDAMVAAAAALGYEYVAITDHSRSAVIARGLDIDRLARQRDEVLRLREEYPAMRILHGSEVDILPDGRLDFPDEVLAGLDIVLASLHDPAGQPGPMLTERYIRAMEHPLVHIITHPTNRLVPTRAGYTLDEERLFEAAVRTQTIVEIDGAPGHLDMDGEMAARAIAAGVIVSIDSDCHRADLLGRQMQLGVGTARRGGIAAHHVVNTRPLADLQMLLARKRNAA